METLIRFWREDAGATAMEYGLILGLAGSLAWVAIYAFYTGLDGLFNKWGGWFQEPGNSPAVGN